MLLHSNLTAYTVIVGAEVDQSRNNLVFNAAYLHRILRPEQK